MGRWRGSSSTLAGTGSRKTLGILGFGHIGQAVARRAVAFDMRVCAVRREAQTEIPSGVSFVGGLERLNEVLRLSDYLAVTLSLSSATQNLIDEQRLRLMKPAAFLINVARAEIFDEAALYAALSSGRVRGRRSMSGIDIPRRPNPHRPRRCPFTHSAM